MTNKETVCISVINTNPVPNTTTDSHENRHKTRCIYCNLSTVRYYSFAGELVLIAKINIIILFMTSPSDEPVLSSVYPGKRICILIRGSESTSGS